MIKIKTNKTKSTNGRCYSSTLPSIISLSKVECLVELKEISPFYSQATRASAVTGRELRSWSAASAGLITWTERSCDLSLCTSFVPFEGNESRESDGRLKRAYASPKNAAIPKDFLKELAKNKKAQAFFETLNKTNLYSITYRLENAKKSETRTRWIQKIIEMLSKGEKFHP